MAKVAIENANQRAAQSDRVVQQGAADRRQGVGVSAGVRSPAPARDRLALFGRRRGSSPAAATSRRSKPARSIGDRAGEAGLTRRFRRGRTSRSPGSGRQRKPPLPWPASRRSRWISFRVQHWCAITVLVSLEDMGFCPKVQSGPFVAERSDLCRRSSAQHSQWRSALVRPARNRRRNDPRRRSRSPT